MILTFNEIEYARFDTDIVDAFLSGKEVQYRNKKDGVWDTYKKFDDSRFGPWYYNKMYEWRVKPTTIEIEVDREVKTITKVTVEIPAPFKGEIPLEAYYNLVDKNKDNGRWYITRGFKNYAPSVAKQHQESGYIYLDVDAAQKDVRILNGE